MPVLLACAIEDSTDICGILVPLGGVVVVVWTPKTPRYNNGFDKEYA